MSTTAILTLRFAKLLAAVLFAAGALGTVIAADFTTRRRFAYLVGGPGLGLSWVLGFLLSYATGRSLFSSFILLSLLASLVTLHGILYLAGKEGRGGLLSYALVLVPLIATFALMVFRPD